MNNLTLTELNRSFPEKVFLAKNKCTSSLESAWTCTSTEQNHNLIKQIKAMDK